MDLKKATKKSIYDSKVNSIDNLGTNESEFDSILTSMETVATEFIQRVQSNITEFGMSVTGKSSQLQIEVINDKNLIITAPASLFFVDEGVNGRLNNVGSRFGYTLRRPPIEPIKEWIRARQLQSKRNRVFKSEADFAEMDEEEKITQMAWAISTKRYNEGVLGKDIMQKEIPKLVDDLVEELLNNAAGDVLSKLIIQTPETAKRASTRMNAPSSPVK